MGRIGYKKVLVEIESNGKTLTFEAPNDVGLGDLVSGWMDTFWIPGGTNFVGKIVSLESNYDGICSQVEKI